MDINSEIQEYKMQKSEIKIGFVTVSDRASRGEYEDLGGPAMQEWISKALTNEWTAVAKVIADEQSLIESTLIDMVDNEGCGLILTTGGTGPAKRDVTPEATEQVCDKILDGFAEQMRAVSLQYVPTAILSRQIAGTRGSCLIINLPGKPSAIGECLEAVFPAVPYCIDLIEGPYLESDDTFVKGFRPKHAKRS